MEINDIKMTAIEVRTESGIYPGMAKIQQGETWVRNKPPVSPRCLLGSCQVPGKMECVVPNRPNDPFQTL